MDTRSVEIAVLLRNTCRSWQTWLFFSAKLKGSLTFRLGGGIAMACLLVRDLEKKQCLYKNLLVNQGSVTESSCPMSVRLDVCLRHRVQLFFRPLNGPEVT